MGGGHQQLQRALCGNKDILPLHPLNYPYKLGTQGGEIEWGAKEGWSEATAAYIAYISSEKNLWLVASLLAHIAHPHN